MPTLTLFLVCFFFSDPATTELYTLSLHDALPIYSSPAASASRSSVAQCAGERPACSRSEEHTSELQSHSDLVCRLLLEKKKLYLARYISQRMSSGLFCWC